ncbi:MAG: hypothetical protein Rubg2KO_26310 [Rubricoccaceae bacterium]
MRALLTVFLLALPSLAYAQADSLQTVEFFELASQRAGVGAIDTLRLNLSSDYDANRGMLYLTGTSMVEPLHGEEQPTRAIVRVYMNVHERMIPDALLDYVNVCSGLGWYQAQTVSHRNGEFTVVIPIDPDRLRETLGCLSVAATTTNGADAVGAVAYGVAR